MLVDAVLGSSHIPSSKPVGACHGKSETSLSTSTYTNSSSSSRCSQICEEAAVSEKTGSSGISRVCWAAPPSGGGCSRAGSELPPKICAGHANLLFHLPLSKVATLCAVVRRPHLLLLLFVYNSIGRDSSKADKTQEEDKGGQARWWSAGWPDCLKPPKARTRRKQRLQSYPGSIAPIRLLSSRFLSAMVCWTTLVRSKSAHRSGILNTPRNEPILRASPLARDPRLQASPLHLGPQNQTRMSSYHFFPHLQRGPAPRVILTASTQVLSNQTRQCSKLEPKYIIPLYYIPSFSHYIQHHSLHSTIINGVKWKLIL